MGCASQVELKSFLNDNFSQKHKDFKIVVLWLGLDLNYKKCNISCTKVYSRTIRNFNATIFVWFRIVVIRICIFLL